MTNHDLLFKQLPEDKLKDLSKEELIILLKGEQSLNRQLNQHIDKLHAKYLANEKRRFLLEQQTIIIKNKLFGKSSERSSTKSRSSSKKGRSKKRILLPSERYPEAMVVEKLVELEELPTCSCCHKQMKDSGLTEDSEYLTAIPRQFLVVKQKRVKYRCSTCQDKLIVAPAIPRIKAGSSYSDEMVIDVALSKYCDLIPIERYVQMASRNGIKGLPANTLIEGTHNLASYLLPVYEKIKKDVLNNKVLHADETPHRMLEGDKKNNWYLWGFSTAKGAYFEAHDTRSGSVASDMIKKSSCEFLISDVYSGYSKAVSDSNQYRKESKLPLISNCYCNAHARRKFVEAEKVFEKEAKLFLWCYQKIYRLEKNKGVINRRKWQKSYYRLMEREGLKLRNSYSTKSSLIKAINYLLKNFDGLTLYLSHEEIPIDNNGQERLMRAPVIGRKTWYGTHSKRGARTNAVIFSLVESCKLNKVNPREYFRDIVHTIHESKPIYTPSEYKRLTPAKNA